VKKLVSIIITLCFVCTSLIPTMSTFAEVGDTLGFGADSESINLNLSFPSISVTVPENVSEPFVNMPLYENFEESTNVFDNANYNKYLYSMVKDTDNPDNTVLEYNLKGATTVAKYGGTIRTSKFTYPDAKVPYTVSFDFKKIADGNAGDCIWVQSRSAGQYTCVRIDMSQFVKGEWYTVQYVTKGNGTATSASTSVCTKTLKRTGETTSLTCGVTTGWTSQMDNICITTYNNAGDKYTVDPETGTTPWANVAFCLDNVAFSYESAKFIKTKLTSDETSSETVVPMLCAYDKNGVMTSVLYSEKSVDTSTSVCEAEFDIMKSIKEFENAESVKALYWNSFDSAIPCASFVEIGDEISDKNEASHLETKTLSIDNTMIPNGISSDYTVFAYTVPFTVSTENIPAFDASKHTILGVWQENEKISSVKYDASLYDEEKQDIVVVCSGKGAQAPVKTLIEVNNAPQFTNISMLLGSDSTQRNFTWFSLSPEQGKITYEKMETMIDGEFSSNAKTVTATREHDSSEYSKKEYYYQNKAVMTDLETETEYCYQISNGNSQYKKVYFTTYDNDSSFSFAFGGDPQVGGNDNCDYAQETLDWGRTLNQITTSAEFDGIEFFVSGGDQIESASTNALIEAQYDIYLNHDEFLTLPQAVVLGNHDNKPAGYHVHHFNQPNMDINYGATYMGGQLNSADYYFVYNSALFIVLNTNDFDDYPNDAEASRLDDKANADKHGEFIRKALEETKDNKDILWKIVLYHQSPYGSSYHGNYTTDSSGAFNRTEQYNYVNMREYLMPYLYEAGVDLVLSGHDHCYTRTHIIKPAKDENGNYTPYSEITPYKNTSEDGENYYTYSDGTTSPTYVSWTDKTGKVYDGVQNEYLKVKYQPSKVTDPDGILHVTGASSSGSQVNGVDHPNHYASVALRAETRHMSRIDITENTLKLTTYNLGSNTTNDIREVDSFTIEKTDNIPVMGVEIEENLTLPVGQSKELKAKLSPSEPTNGNVLWTSDNEDVATVDQSGKITAKNPGAANITVETVDGGYKAVCKVTVVEAIKVTKITLPQGIKINVGDIKTLIPDIYPDNATTKNLSWSVDNDELATINSNGTLTAKAHGTITVTATATDGSGVSASTNVLINYTPSVVELESEFLTMNIADEQTLWANVSPSNASYKEISWSSSDESIATIDQNGKIYALKAGTVTIKASTKDSSASCTLKVNASTTFSQNFEDDANKVLWTAETSVWSRIENENGDYILEFDGSKIDSKIGTRYTAQIKSGTDTIKIPPASVGYAMEFEITRLSSGGHSSLYINTYSSDSSCKSFKLDMRGFEIGTAYDVKVVFYGTQRKGYYKKAEDKFWIKDNGTVWQDGQNITSNMNFNHVSMYPFDNITDLEIAKKTSFVMDDIKFSTIDENDISVINKGTVQNVVLDIKTGTGDAGCKVFVAAYTENKMAYVVSEPCDVNGNATVSFEITGEEDLFKVFVFKDEITPLKPNIICQ